MDDGPRRGPQGWQLRGRAASKASGWWESIRWELGALPPGHSVGLVIALLWSVSSPIRCKVQTRSRRASPSLILLELMFLLSQGGKVR